MAAIDRLDEGAATNALMLVEARTDRSGLTRSTTRAAGTSEAGVVVTDASDDAGANGTPWSPGDPTRLTRSHVEKGAVHGDKISTISQFAAIFVSIGAVAHVAKKAPRPRAIWCEKMRRKIAEGAEGSHGPIDMNVC